MVRSGKDVCLIVLHEAAAESFGDESHFRLIWLEEGLPAPKGGIGVGKDKGDGPLCLFAFRPRDVQIISPQR